MAITSLKHRLDNRILGSLQLKPTELVRSVNSMNNSLTVCEGAVTIASTGPCDLPWVNIFHEIVLRRVCKLLTPRTDVLSDIYWIDLSRIRQSILILLENGILRTID